MALDNHQWPEVFVKGALVSYTEESLKIDLILAQALFMLGNKPPANFSKGCVFISSILGADHVRNLMEEIRNSTKPATR